MTFDKKSIYTNIYIYIYISCCAPSFEKTTLPHVTAEISTCTAYNTQKIYI